MKFWTHKYWFFALLLLTVPFVPRKPEPLSLPVGPAVKTVRVRAGVVESTLRLAGTIATEDSVTLRAPRMPGRRSRGGRRDFSLTLLKLAKAGATVERGQIVAEFDPVFVRQRADDQRDRLTQDEFNLRRLRAELGVRMNAHRQQLRIAKGQLDKAALDLKTVPVRSAIQAEILRLTLEEAQARYERLLKEVPLAETSERAALRISELEVADERIELKRDEANMERLKIPSPIEGIVVPQPVRRSNQMAEVAQGDELRFGQPFVTIVNTAGLIVEAQANQVDVEQIRLGLPAHVRFDALSGLVLSGKVAAVGAVAAGSRHRPDYVRQVPVRIELNENHPKVFPNASASADIILHSEEAPAILPRHCVFDSESGSPKAYVRTGEGWEERDLVLGVSNHVEVAVLDGVREGELVAAEQIATR